MPIKKSKAITKSRKFKKSRKSKSKLNRKYRNSKKNKSGSKSKNGSKSKRYNNHKGGASCDLVTVSEPGFNVDALGSMAGLAIASSTAAIYRPNCPKNISSQAMAP